MKTYYDEEFSKIVNKESVVIVKSVYENLSEKTEYVSRNCKNLGYNQDDLLRKKLSSLIPAHFSEI